MRKQKKRFAGLVGLLAVIFGICGIGSAPSAQAFDLSAFGIMTISNYELSTSIPSTSGATFGAGGTIGFGLSPFFGLETGALFMNHSFSTTSGTTNTSLNYNFMDIPVLLRFTPLPFLAINGGIYYGIPLSANVSVSSLGTTISNATSSSGDFGFMFGAGIRIPLAPIVKLRVDALYQMGLTNVGTASSTQNSRNLNILAGVMLDLW